MPDQPIGLTNPVPPSTVPSARLADLSARLTVRVTAVSSYRHQYQQAYRHRLVAHTPITCTHMYDRIWQDAWENASRMYSHINVTHTHTPNACTHMYNRIWQDAWEHASRMYSHLSVTHTYTRDNKIWEYSIAFGSRIAGNFCGLKFYSQDPRHL